jgi:RNA polymerase sigma-70 factor (family 1)
MAGYSAYNDQELLALVKADDYAAFTEIYHRHSDALYGVSYNILRDRAGCKDIVQDLFIWFWQHRAQWQLQSCRGYLLAAVKFKTANYIRDNKVHKGFFTELSGVELPDEDEATRLEVKELSGLIRGLADQLPGRYGEIFRMSRYQHLSNKEIALQMGVTEKTVENQMTIALRKLREQLGPYGMFTLFL